MRALPSILAFVAAFGLLLSVPARAQEEDGGADPASPQLQNGLITQVSLLPEQMKRNYVRIRSVPFKDPTLAFQFVGHSDWEWVAAETKVKSALDFLIPLGGLYTPNWENDQASITVGYGLVPREIDLEDWISVYTLKNGFRVHRTQFGTVHGKPMADALAERKEGEDRWITRLTVMRDGGRLLVLEGRAKLAGFAKHAPTFAIAATSLRFEERATVMGSEATEELVLSSPFRLAFLRPGSLQAETETNEPLGTQIAHLWNLSREGAVAGYVTVRAFDRERFPDLTPKALIQEFVKQLGESSLKLKQFPAKGLPEADGKTFDRERMSAGYIREDTGAPVEAQVVVASNAKILVLVGMVSPGIAGSEGMWLVNRQAFRMAVESLKTD